MRESRVAAVYVYPAQAGRDKYPVKLLLDEDLSLSRELAKGLLAP